MCVNVTRNHFYGYRAQYRTCMPVMTTAQVVEKLKDPKDDNKVLEIPKTIKDAHGYYYLSGKQLGAGGFATCWSADMYRPDEPTIPQKCALKAVKSKVPKNLVQRFRLELAIQSKLRHPHLVALHRAFTFEDVTYVSLELCSNGSLTDMMRRRKYLTMGEIRRIIIQLSGAVKHLHGRDVVHRDIKAGNIFLDADMNVKLGDFGLAAIMEPSAESGADAKTLQHIRRTTFCGTPNYLAPEILSRSKGHGTSVDIWSIGILAYYLSVGRAPFHSKSKDEIYARLRQGEYSWPELAPEQNEIPEDLKDFVGMLLVEESKRPKPDDIVQHPFLKDGYIPAKLETLCLTRRPKWARTGESLAKSQQDGTRQTWTAICKAAGLGKDPKIEILERQISTASEEAESVAQMRVRLAELRKEEQRKRGKSMFLVLAKEMSQKVKLEIPLKEGLVYTGGTRANQSVLKTAVSAVGSSQSVTQKNTSTTRPPLTTNATQSRTIQSSASNTVEAEDFPNVRDSASSVAITAPGEQQLEGTRLKPVKAKRPTTGPAFRFKPSAVIEILEDSIVSESEQPKPASIPAVASKPSRTSAPKFKIPHVPQLQQQKQSRPASPHPQTSVSAATQQPQHPERKLAERPKRLLRRREPPAMLEMKPATQRRAALQINDQGNRVRRRVAHIESKAGNVVEL